jgi:amino acid transporter
MALYLTLFAAAILIIGDLVALLYNFLEGELTTRFALKIVAVLVVAAAIFWYYLYDLRRKPGEFSDKAKWFAWGITGFIALVVVYGFFVAGSPFKQRLVRFDSQRISDLQSLKYQVVGYWQAKDRLPASLDDLKDSISGFVPPRDPQNGAPYEYRETGKLSFELCAGFNLASAESRLSSPKFAEPVGQTEEIWDHGAGRACFSRVIDPDIYGRKDKIPPPIR